MAAKSDREVKASRANLCLSQHSPGCSLEYQSMDVPTL